ncbi:MAG: hypothetical protein R2827_12685 [Bdellovibrionales bacterium]
MNKFKLVYFEGCPNAQPAQDLLNAIGIEFQLICQDQLNDSDTLRNYSSPTLLAGDEIIFGAKATGGGCSMPLPSKAELLKLLNVR